MLGAVLHQEMLLGSRRNKLHAWRWVYAGWLVLCVSYFYFLFLVEDNARLRARARTAAGLVNQASAPEVVGSRFAESFVRQQQLLLLLVTPAFVAGAIADEKRRGTLQHLLVADLDGRHLILGKLLGRVAQVTLILLGGVPLFALLAGFGGVEPATMLAVPLVLFMPVLGVAAASILASVLCRQTRDAVLVVYGASLVGILLVYLVGGVLDYLSPVYVLAPAWGASSAIELPEVGRRLGYSTLAWGAVTAVCVGLALWRLRPAYVRELESVRPTRLRWYAVERVPVGDDPVRWKEQHVEGLAPNPALRRVPQWLGVTLVALLSAASSLLILYAALAPGKAPADVLRALLLVDVNKLAALLPDAGFGFRLQGVAVMLLASLAVGVRCSGSVTGERERQTWEALLLTPVSAKHILRAKLWGVLTSTGWYLLAYAAPAVCLATLGGAGALFSVVVCLAVTLLAMYFMGAAGLWCSVRSRNSWRALLGTVLVGYVGGLLLYVITGPVLLIVYIFLLLMLLLTDFLLGTRLAPIGGMMSFSVFFVTSCVGMAFAFWLTARLFMGSALRWVADRERTRHWDEEPVYRRPRRAPVPSLGR